MDNRTLLRNENNIINIVLKCTVILAASIIIGTILLCLVYLIPTAPIKNNLTRDIDELAYEGQYPALKGIFANTLDNFTDSLMLGTASCDREGSVIDKAMNVYHPVGDGDSVQNLIQYINSDKSTDYSAYTRYWQGYLVFLKPILCFTNYLIWRSINHVLQIILMIVTAVILIRKCSWKCVIPFATAVAFIRPNIIYYSLQYSTMFYISLLSVAVLALFYDKLKKNGLIYYFFIVGIITNYFDFLTYPALGLGFCLVLCAMIDSSEKGLKAVFNTVKYSFFWTAGYGGMWAGKWLISSILLHRNVFIDAMNSIGERASSYASGEEISRIYTVYFNIRTFFEGLYYFVPIIILIAVVVIGIWQWKKMYMSWMGYLLNLFIIALIPIVWYLVLSNHSFMHLYFTDRELAISVAAITAAAWRIDRKKT